MRHGETVDLRLGRCSGRGSDPPLTPAGRRQMRRVADRLRSVDVATAYCSPLRRCRQSADIVVDDPGAVTSDERLEELDFGAWEGRDWGDVRADQPDLLRRWRRDPDRHAPPGGETLGSLAARLRSFRERMSREWTAGTALIVSHDGALRVLLCGLIGVPPRKATAFSLSPASVSTLLVSVDGEAEATVLSLNDTCHLDGLR